MARRVWTAEELERLPRDQQQAIFDESIVADLTTVPLDELPEAARQG